MTRSGKRKVRDVPHEITCTYVGGPGEPYYRPVMSCSCGFDTERCANWEDAGWQMDLHIEEINDSQAVERIQPSGKVSRLVKKEK